MSTTTMSLEERVEEQACELETLLSGFEDVLKVEREPSVHQKAGAAFTIRIAASQAADELWVDLKCKMGIQYPEKPPHSVKVCGYHGLLDSELQFIDTAIAARIDSHEVGEVCMFDVISAVQDAIDCYQQEPRQTSLSSQNRKASRASTLQSMQGGPSTSSSSKSPLSTATLSSPSSLVSSQRSVLASTSSSPASSRITSTTGGPDIPCPASSSGAKSIKWHQFERFPSYGRWRNGTTISLSGKNRTMCPEVAFPAVCTAILGRLGGSGEAGTESLSLLHGGLLPNGTMSKSLLECRLRRRKRDPPLSTERRPVWTSPVVEGIEPTARAGHSLTDVGGAFLLMGGVENKQKLSFSIALLCPHPNLKSRYRWISSSGGNCLIHLKTPLLAQVCDHVAVRCSQDEVYIVGGKNADSLSGSILLGELVYSTQCRNPYEFNANIFASFSLSYWARDIFTPRYGHSASLVEDELVVCGGQSASGEFLLDVLFIMDRAVVKVIQYGYQSPVFQPCPPPLCNPLLVPSSRRNEIVIAGLRRTRHGNSAHRDFWKRIGDASEPFNPRDVWQMKLQGEMLEDSFKLRSRSRKRSVHHSTDEDTEGSDGDEGVEDTSGDVALGSAERHQEDLHFGSAEVCSSSLESSVGNLSLERAESVPVGDTDIREDLVFEMWCLNITEEEGRWMRINSRSPTTPAAHPGMRFLISVAASPNNNSLCVLGGLPNLDENISTAWEAVESCASSALSLLRGNAPSSVTPAPFFFFNAFFSNQWECTTLLEMQTRKAFMGPGKKESCQTCLAIRLLVDGDVETTGVSTPEVDERYLHRLFLKLRCPLFDRLVFQGPNREDGDFGELFQSGPFVVHMNGVKTVGSVKHITLSITLRHDRRSFGPVSCADLCSCWDAAVQFMYTDRLDVEPSDNIQLLRAIADLLGFSLLQSVLSFDGRLSTGGSSRSLLSSLAKLPAERSDIPPDLKVRGCWEESAYVIHCHRDILALRSGFYSKVFSRDFAESTQAQVIFEEVSVQAAQIILQFMYTDIIPVIDPEYCVEVWLFSDSVFLGPLSKVAGAVLSQSMDVEEAFALIEAASNARDSSLYNACVRILWDSRKDESSPIHRFSFEDKSRIFQGL